MASPSIQRTQRPAGTTRTPSPGNGKYGERGQQQPPSRPAPPRSQAEPPKPPPR